MTALSGRRLRVLILESHGSGSHARVIELLKRHSRHEIIDLQTKPDHWRKTALIAHFTLADRVRSLPDGWVPDVLVFSGMMHIPPLIALLPADWQSIARIACFHESQWTYPAVNGDVRPYQIQHLDAVLNVNEVWFNSNFHRSVFTNALDGLGEEPDLRGTAEIVAAAMRSRSSVMHPPVALESPADVPDQGVPMHLLWNARWEHDKRPDRFVAMLSLLEVSGITPAVTVAGVSHARLSEIEASLGQFAMVVEVQPGREHYERALHQGGILISTADHEFFGIGALEAVLAGCIPVLPESLAYPETLPSAWFYNPGDIEEVARVVVGALRSGGPLREMHRSDAQRFAPERSVPLWDDGLERVATSRRYIASP